MTMPIEVRNLTKSFGHVVAVENVNFSVPRASVTGFVGANGSGKTTTMRMILGLTNPDSGEAYIEGRPYADLAEPRRTIGAVLSRLGGHPGLTGRQHLRMVAAGAGLPMPRIDEVLADVGLADAADRRTGTYSTGMGQRLALAAALLADPPVLVLDEPANGLDPRGIHWLRQLLRARADAGATVFISTHQLAELAPIVDHLVVIDQGRIVADCGAEALLAQTGHPDLSEAVLAVTS